MGFYLADMQLISKFNKGFRFFLCIIDAEYICMVVPLKNKKFITIVNAFLNILNESGLKPSKIWIDKNREFYKRSMKTWLQDIDLEMYSMHDEGKSVVVERFIGPLRNKI